jgi:hypothetical protein
MAEDPNGNFPNDEENNIDMTDIEGIAGKSNKTSGFNTPADPAHLPSNLKGKIHIRIFKWHWVAVFAVAVIAIYLGLLNGVSLESSLMRALYCTAIFWIIAEVVDWVMHKMQ